MGRWLIVLAVVASCVGFGGCSSGDPAPVDTKPDAAALKASQNKAPATKPSQGGGGMPPASPSGLDPTK